MRITILKLPKFKLTLNIENRFVSDHIIIPIGYDCHPAYMLNKLNLRTKSLPFDWLNMEPITGINYVIENIQSVFKWYLSDLIINERGYIVSSTFPNVEFMHEKDLIESPDTKAKLIRRYKRFNKIFKEFKCNFIYNLPSYCLNTNSDVITFKESVEKFLKLIKDGDRLLLYIRYDENFDENNINCDLLFRTLSSKNKIVIQKYIREKNAYGIWGDEKKYFNFLKALHNGIRRSFPKVYFT